MELKPAVVLNNDRLEVMMQRASGHPSLEKPYSWSQSGPSRGMEDWDFGTLPNILGGLMISIEEYVLEENVVD